MAGWAVEATEKNIGGRFQIVFTKIGGSPVDVTWFRGVPTKIESYSNADPFGDSTAVFTFPQLTGFDDFDSIDVGAWLGDFASVDIWWVPAVLASSVTEGQLHANERTWNDPLTNQLDVYAPTSLVIGGVWVDQRVKVWEGYVASMELTATDQSNQLQIQCQGALFQLDRYLQKPFYPPAPWTLESLLVDVFDKKKKPHLRTQPLKVVFPTGWAKIAPAYDGASANVYTANVRPGQKWTGYTSRATGSWDRCLTGFAQDNISVMVTQDDSGVTPGNQWTIMQQRQQAAKGAQAALAGRTPVLQVRDRFRTPDFALWMGAYGISMSLTRDSTQVANIIYGDGTGTDGTVWRNAVIASNGSRTDYNPLAASPNIFPYTNNKNFKAGDFAAEAYYKYGTGFNQDQAIESAQKSLQRDQTPGWSGTITLMTDPTASLHRFLIQAGMTVKVMGLAGTGSTGLNFHIASVEVDPESGSVTLTVDTRFRDLLNLEEALVRTRDPLTPSKMLQINKASVMVEDVMAPWDYTAGSGFVPKASTAFFAYRPAGESFPSADWMSKHPPFMYPHWYVGIHANAPTRFARWTQQSVPILTSEKGTINRTEVVMVDKYGKIIKNPFHMSIYYVPVTPDAMPFDANGPSPFIYGAFESINPATGDQWGVNTPHLTPQQSMIIGWGNYAQPAGFSPGRESDGANPTGLLVDEGSWQFDNTSNLNFNNAAKPGQKQPASAITLYAMFYAEYSEPVYFMARLYRQNPGT